MQTSRKVMITRRRRRRITEQKPKIFLSLLSLIIVVAAIAFAAILINFLVSIGAAYALYDSFARQLPDPASIETEQEDFETTKIFDRTGQVLLYEIFDPLWGDRNYVILNDIHVQLGDIRLDPRLEGLTDDLETLFESYLATWMKTNTQIIDILKKGN